MLKALVSRYLAIPDSTNQPFAYTHTGALLTITKSILCSNTGMHQRALDKAMPQFNLIFHGGMNMKQFSPGGMRRFRGALLAALLGASVGFVSASPSSDEQALAKGSMEDVTPQQKYSTAIREAGGGYKEWLRECNYGPADLRRACTAEAKATYDRDMARAKLILTTR